MEKFFTTVFNFNEFIFVYTVNLRFIRPPDEEKPGDMVPNLFLKSYFVKDVFWEILFCIILQGIQSFFACGFSGILWGGCFNVMANYIYLRTYLATRILGDFQTFEKIICVS